LGTVSFVDGAAVSSVLPSWVLSSLYCAPLSLSASCSLPVGMVLVVPSNSDDSFLLASCLSLFFQIFLYVAVVAIALAMCALFIPTKFAFSYLFCLFKAVIGASSHCFSSGRCVKWGSESAYTSISLFIMALPLCAQFLRQPLLLITTLSTSSLKALFSDLPWRGAASILSLSAYQQSPSKWIPQVKDPVSQLLMGCSKCLNCLATQLYPGPE
jgi:hypothetical protein